MSTAEQIIAEHRVTSYRPNSTSRCLCGWVGPVTAHAAHVVAALTNAGKQIVDQDKLDSAAASLDAGATIVGNHALMLADLVMDTPKDQELTDRLVELAHKSAQNLRAAAARVAEGGERRG
ncbi:hypothetical protein [Rhodococcus sp. BE178]|uniref:hypothetical protein n=1 Tax=Rhodococcus sp. BE178 TaxID=2817737 RepID=UPI003D1BB8FD